MRVRIYGRTHTQTQRQRQSCRHINCTLTIHTPRGTAQGKVAKAFEYKNQFPFKQFTGHSLNKHTHTHTYTETVAETESEIEMWQMKHKRLMVSSMSVPAKLINVTG